MTTTIFKVEDKIIKCKSKAEEFLSDNDYANTLLDSISSVSKAINNVNDCYLRLFKHFEDLSTCKVSDKKEIESLKNIILEISKYTTQSSIVFASISKNNILSKGCKEPLNDLRANIRTIREFLEDIEETFLLEESEELNNLVVDLL